MMWDSWDVTTYTGLTLDEEEADRIYLMSPEELLREAEDLKSRPRKKRVASQAFLLSGREYFEYSCICCACGGVAEGIWRSSTFWIVVNNSDSDSKSFVMNSSAPVNSPQNRSLF